MATIVSVAGDGNVHAAADIDTSFGLSTTVTVQSVSGAAYRKGLVWFDLSTYTNGTISNAKINLNIETAPASAVTWTCYPMNLKSTFPGAWVVESTFTWNSYDTSLAWFNAGIDYDTGTSDDIGLPSSGAFSFNVPNCMAYLVAAGYMAQAGFVMLQTAGTNRSFIFTSKQGTTAANRPYLSFDYAVTSGGNRAAEGRPTSLRGSTNRAASGRVSI